MLNLINQQWAQSSNSNFTITVLRNETQQRSFRGGHGVFFEIVRRASPQATLGFSLNHWKLIGLHSIDNRILYTLNLIDEAYSQDAYTNVD